MGRLHTFGEAVKRAIFLPPKTNTALRKVNFSGVTWPVDQLRIHQLGQSGSYGPVTREQALSVPAVQQGLRLIGQVATLPLHVYRIADREIVDNPLFRQIDPDVPNVITMKQTIDDLVFEGVSWWQITSRDFAGFPISARHLDVNSVHVQEANDRRTPAPLPSGIDPRGAKVFVDSIDTPWSDLIRFDSPNPPLLQAGAASIRLALALMASAELYGKNPRPLDFFTPTPGAQELTDDEIQERLNDWERRRRTHTTGWVPEDMTYNPVDSPTPQQLQINEQLRQVTVDISNSMGVDADDLGVAVNDETYNNAQDRRQDRINSVHAPYMRAITDRLSMGDVTRRGYEVKFDLSDYLKSNPTEQVAYWKALMDMGVMDAAEVRAAAGLSGPPPKAEPAPQPVLEQPPIDAQVGADPATEGGDSNAAL